MNHAINLTSQRISFVNKISILQKALSNDETPTPIYLFREINCISFESIGYCESLVEFLVDRLRHGSCNVKLKVLKVMKYVVQNGSKEFQLGLRQNVESVKECTKYSGVAHPVHGNTPYVMVRRLAVELCDMLYNLDPLALKFPSTEEPRLPDSKYGGMGQSRSGGSIQGFGNSPTTPQSKGIASTILHEIEKLGSKLSETPADRQAAVLARLNLSASSSNYQPPVISPDVGGSESIPHTNRHMKPPSPQTEPVADNSVSHHLPGKAGGGWNDEEDDDGNDNDSNDDHNDNTDSRIEDTSDQFKGQSVDYGFISNDQPGIKQEMVLLDRILSSSDEDSKTVKGINTAYLSYHTINYMLSQCASLRCGVVVDCLCDRLGHHDPFIINRCLQLLEGLIYSRRELINLDLLTSKCKAPLVVCFTTAGEQSQDIELDDDIVSRWKCVQMKSAKILLILQQLSSHKQIISNSQIVDGLKSSLLPGFTQIVSGTDQ